MKKYNILVFSILMLGIGFILSCSTPCKDVTCSNDGVCNDGDCICVDGYMGDDCSIEERAHFIGTYSVVQSCIRNGNPLDNVNYNDTINARGDSPKNLAFSNFVQFPGVGITTPVIATIDGVNLTIPKQIFGFAEIEGSGILSGNILTISLNFENFFGTDVCTLVYTKN